MAADDARQFVFFLEKIFFVPGKAWDCPPASRYLREELAIGRQQECDLRATT
jgi:hypothetical protein